MDYSKIILASAIIAIGAMSCKTQYDLLLEGNDVDAKYAAAFDYFNQGKYSKSAQLFESLSSITSGTSRDDTVQYYWGLSNYRARDYYTAETNFESFTNSFPRSPFTENARFLRIDCLYRETLRYELDQTPTYKAITAISEYIVEYPDNDHMAQCSGMLTELGNRLDRKAFENARLYYKMEDYKAARTAFRNILKDDADNIYREDILYYTAMSSYKFAEKSVPAKQKERYMTFIDDYYNFAGECSESSHNRELKSLYKKALKAVGRNVAEEQEASATEAEK